MLLLNIILGSIKLKFSDWEQVVDFLKTVFTKYTTPATTGSFFYLTKLLSIFSYFATELTL